MASLEIDVNMADVKWLEDLKAKIVDQKDSDNFDDNLQNYLELTGQVSYLGERESMVSN